MPQNEVITYAPGSVASPVTPVAGTYTVTFGGQTSAAIAWDADQATVLAAWEAMSSVGAGNVSITDLGQYNWQVEFIGDLAETDVGSVTINSSVKQAASTVTLTETQMGVDAVNEQQVVQTGAAMSGSIGISNDGGSTTELWDITTGESGLQAVMDTLYGSGNIDVTDSAGDYIVDFQGSLAGQNIAEMTVESDTTDGGGAFIYTQQDGGGLESIWEISLDDAPTEGKFILTENAIYGMDADPLDFDATAGEVETAVEALAGGYGVAGSGPWTITTDSGVYHHWSGREDDSSPAPLRKALTYEVVVDQEGEADSSVSGDVAMTQAVAGMAASGLHGYTGTASMTQAAASVAAAGFVPFTATVEMAQPAASVAADGTVTNPVEAEVAMTQAAATMDATGHVPYTGTVELAQPAASVTAEGFTRMDIEGTLAMTQAVAGMSAIGGSSFTCMVGISQPAATVAARGRKRYGDTALPFKHIEHRTVGIG